MLPKVNEILKLRWPEAMMLIGLFAGLSALGARITQEFYMAEEMAQQLPFLSAFLLGVGLMTLIILLGMLFLGFLRSVILEPLVPRHPVELLRFGKPYFWKLFLFYIVFELAWTVLSLLMVGVLHGVLLGKKPVDQIPDWMLRFSQLAGLAILIKPFLLMPSIILLKNNSIREAFIEFRGILLSGMPRLVKAIWSGYVLLLTVFVVLYLIPFPRQFFWIRIGILSIVAGGAFLFFFVTALLEIQDHIRFEPQDKL